MKHETGIIAVEVFDIEHCVQRPEVILDKKDIPDAAASARNHSRPTNRTLVMCVTDPTGTDERIFSADTVLCRQVEAPL